MISPLIHNKLCPFILFFILYGNHNLWSQDTIVNSSAYEVFDHMVGYTNTGIFDGIEYFEKFPVRNEKHKFFKSSEFVNGLLIYEGNPFLNVELKYDVYDNQLLIRNSEVLGFSCNTAI